MSSMHEVEVIVPRTALPAATKTFRGLGSVRVLAEPSGATTKERVCMLPSSELDRSDIDAAGWVDSMRRRLQAAPVVLLWQGRQAGDDRRLMQQVASISSAARTPVYVAPDAAAARRLALARTNGAERKLIASAELQGESIEVWSCEPRPYRLPLDRVPALVGLSPAARKDFKVSPSGSRISWPAADVDLDLASIRAVTDPTVVREQRQVYRTDAARYGRTIRALREERGITQKGVEGLSDRTLRRIERGEVLPHASTLARLAAAHGLSVGDYMAALAARMSGERNG